MISKIISQLIGDYDSTVMQAKELFLQRDKNLKELAALFEGELKKILIELAETDKRLSVKPRHNGGLSLSFNDKMMFGVGVNVYTERMEVWVDGQRVVQYDGINRDMIEKFSHRPVAFLRSSILAAFQHNLNIELQRAIDAI